MGMTILTKSDNYPNSELKKTDSRCIAEKLKMSQNGDKLVSIDLGVNAMTYAAFMCSNVEREIQDIEFDKKIEKISSIKEYLADEINCVKAQLHKFEPSSQFLHEFNPVEDAPEECEVFDEFESGLIEVFKKSKADHIELGIGNCFDDDEKNLRVNTRIYKMIIAALREPQDQIELGNLKNEFTNDAIKDSHNIFKCIMGSVNALTA
jgi:hypothetical protein